MKIKRFLKHLLTGRWLVKSYFSKEDLDRIVKEIANSEDKHHAEIRVAIEANLSPLEILKGVDPKNRSIQVFSFLRIWDTEDNNGVLIYLLLADREIEILADRGIYKALGHDYWEEINREVIHYFKEKKYVEGILYAIEKITTQMVLLFPPKGDNPNELCNEIVIL